MIEDKKDFKNKYFIIKADIDINLFKRIKEKFIKLGLDPKNILLDTIGLKFGIIEWDEERDGNYVYNSSCSRGEEISVEEFLGKEEFENKNMSVKDDRLLQHLLKEHVEFLEEKIKRIKMLDMRDKTKMIILPILMRSRMKCLQILSTIN